MHKIVNPRQIRAKTHELTAFYKLHRIGATNWFSFFVSNYWSIESTQKNYTFSTTRCKEESATNGIKEAFASNPHMQN